MKVRRAIIKDLKRVQDLYGIVSDEMAGTIYDIMWRRDIYPSKTSEDFNQNEFE